MLDSRKNKKAYNENKVVTMIGPGTLLTGELKCKGTIRVEGGIDGTVRSEDSIVVLESGKVKGDLMAGQVIVSGEVHGNIQAFDRIEITPKAKVVGDICAPRISIHEGVLFEGQCAMKAPGDLPPKGAEKTTAS
ncbi:MAG: polymer-forming cytoskeletal protein [Candidatus Hydrogenedentes bacterium]|nr:polymer-forming cytoskeletal protein [Candidatus Hydrogenedentota bacterium]